MVCFLFSLKLTLNFLSNVFLVLELCLPASLFLFFYFIFNFLFFPKGSKGYFSPYFINNSSLFLYFVSFLFFIALYSLSFALSLGLSIWHLSIFIIYHSLLWLDILFYSDSSFNFFALPCSLFILTLSIW